MGIWNFQSVLNKGELDPIAVGRIDLLSYYNGVAEATNVLAIPQGGLKKRPGQEYISTAVYDSDGSNGRLEKFSFNVDINYLLVFTDLRMQVFKEGVLQTNINGSGNDYLVTPWSIDEIAEFDYIQSADTIIITHEDIQSKRITRTSDTAWALSDLPLENIPQYNYDDFLSPSGSDALQGIAFTNFNEGDRFKLSLEGILTDEIVFSDTVAGRIALASDIQEELLSLPNTPNSGIEVTHAVAASYNIFFTDAAQKDWDQVVGTQTHAQNAAFTITASTALPGASSDEDTWSATRGWPRTCTFHESRLWFGGSKSRPQTIWGSFVNDFYNFKTRKALDDESVSATLDTDQLNTIQGIFSNRSLQVFTSGGEFYVPESPITPENIAVLPQTNYGSKRVRPVTIDGITLFIQRTGKAILQFIFLDEFQANQTTSVSVLAPHLIKDPTKLAVSQGTATSDANYVYIVNADGSMTVFNTLSAQDVAGFTRWDSGNIKSVAVVSDKVYVLILRGGPGAYHLDLEVENSLLNTDGAVYTTGTDLATITGLDHLEGETVKIKADGAVRADAVVVSGSVSIDPVADIVEVGLWYAPVIKTLPLNVNLQNGPNASQKKKIMRASVQIYESNGVLLDGQRIADKTIGVDQFDAPAPQTGLRRIFLSGWSLEASVTITQDTPMDMTILNIGLEVKV